MCWVISDKLTNAQDQDEITFIGYDDATDVATFHRKSDGMVLTGKWGNIFDEVTGKRFAVPTGAYLGNGNIDESKLTPLSAADAYVALQQYNAKFTRDRQLPMPGEPVTELSGGC